MGFILCITLKDLSVVRSDEGVSSVKKKEPEKLNPWKDRMDKILEFGTSSSFLAGLAGTATIALSAAAIAEVEREKQHKALISPKESNKNLSWKNPVKNRSEKSHASYSKGKSPSLCTEKKNAMKMKRQNFMILMFKRVQSNIKVHLILIGFHNVLI